jgi:hypothetical protein
MSRVGPAADEDDAYLAAFEAGQVSGQDFRHQQHLRLAWACIRTAADEDAACTRVGGLIRRFATALGHPGKYHETLTLFWVRLLWAHHQRLGGVTFQKAIAHNPSLLDKDFVFRFYPRELLDSPQARSEWIAPTLLSIAEHASEAHPSPAAGNALGGAVPRA